MLPIVILPRVFCFPELSSVVAIRTVMSFPPPTTFFGRNDGLKDYAFRFSTGRPFCTFALRAAEPFFSLFFFQDRCPPVLGLTFRFFFYPSLSTCGISSHRCTGTFELRHSNFDFSRSLFFRNCDTGCLSLRPFPFSSATFFFFWTC